MDYKQQLKTNKHIKAIENLIGIKVILNFKTYELESSNHF